LEIYVFDVNLARKSGIFSFNFVKLVWIVPSMVAMRKKLEQTPNLG